MAWCCKHLNSEKEVTWPQFGGTEGPSRLRLCVASSLLSGNNTECPDVTEPWLPLGCLQPPRSRLTCPLPLPVGPPPPQQPRLPGLLLCSVANAFDFLRASSLGPVSPISTTAAAAAAAGCQHKRKPSSGRDREPAQHHGTQHSDFPGSENEKFHFTQLLPSEVSPRSVRAIASQDTHTPTLTAARPLTAKS